MKRSLGLVLAIASSAALAQFGDLGGSQGKIGSVLAEPAQVKAGQAVRITVQPEGNAPANCGLYVNFGDGNDTSIKISSSHQKFPVTVSHTYAKAGSYEVKAEGRKVTTYLSCPGKASVQVAVAAADPVAAAPVAGAVSCPEGYTLKGKAGKAKDFTCNAGKNAKKPEKILECADGLEYFQTKTTLGCRKAKK